MAFNHPDMDKFLHRGVAERLGLGIVPKDHDERAANLRKRLSDMPLFDMIERGGDKETCVDLISAAMDSTSRHALDCIVRLDDVVHSRAVTAIAAMEMMTALSAFFSEIAESMTELCASHVTAHRSTLPPAEQAKLDEEMDRDVRALMDELLGHILKEAGKR